MTIYVASNNGYSTLAGGISNVDTTIAVQTGHGARFPVVTNAVHHTFVTLEDAGGNIEVVKVTARTTDSMTIVRAQEGTSARAWNSGDIVECRPTAGVIQDKMSLSSNNAMAAAVNEARAIVASHATTADIWGALGNSIDWTGTATTTAFPNAPQAGVSRELICAGACAFTAGANMLIDGVASAATVTCAAGDMVTVTAVTTSQFKLARRRYDGKAQVESVTTGANVFVGQQTFAETKDTPFNITDGAAFEIDPVNGNFQTVTLGASRTPKATNFEAGQGILLGIDDGSAYTLTWSDGTLNPTWVKSGGTASAPALAATGYTWVYLWKVGSTMYGVLVGSP